MSRKLLKVLGDWPCDYIHDADLAIQLRTSDSARYDIVKRAMKSGVLVRVRRGFYLIGPPIRKVQPDLFELAQQICAPSAISFETALAHHGWIPEAVYAVYSATPKRTRSFETPVGIFHFLHTPLSGFYVGVERSEDPVCFLASPWKAIADIAYCKRLKWNSAEDLAGDLRINEELLSSDLETLQQLATTYGSLAVRKLLTAIYRQKSNDH